MDLEQAKQKLSKYQQGHLLKYFEELTDNEKKKLLQQIEETDFSAVTRIANKEKEQKQGKISPIDVMQLGEIKQNQEFFTQTGNECIRSGKVGAVLLAGGMGTRLGSDAPKGMYNIGITKPVYIFQRIIENLFEVVDKTKTWIHLFIMTSEKNHEMTVSFFKEKQFFGYDENHIHFFRQDMAPASDYRGNIYLDEKGKLATSPNGNGGWYTSMANAGLSAFMKQEGIEWLNVFAVDNVLQKIADPCFIGAALAKNCEVGAKVVRKNHPDEKVGVICLEDGHPSIVEYYELTDMLRNTMTKDGEPAYNFGVILNYLFKVSSLETIVSRELPLHIVEKKIPYLNENGSLCKPEEPNGYKFETLILDFIKLLSSCLPFEVERDKEFAPIKNKTGIDSVESARKLLKQNGIVL